MLRGPLGVPLPDDRLRPALCDRAPGRAGAADRFRMQPHDEKEQPARGRLRRCAARLGLGRADRDHAGVQPAPDPPCLNPVDHHAQLREHASERTHHLFLPHEEAEVRDRGRHLMELVSMPGTGRHLDRDGDRLAFRSAHGRHRPRLEQDDVAVANRPLDVLRSVERRRNPAAEVGDRAGGRIIEMSRLVRPA